MSDNIVFQVETSRVLKILASDIYDSPLALLRENLQNAYDAIRQRFAADGKLADGGRIDITIEGNLLTIADNGIGMTEEVLTNNFWKAGSSGKNNEGARKAGVVGTFGIGAMANFGVCSKIVVETRAEGSSIVLSSTAEKESLKVGQKCIRLEAISSNREFGTTLRAHIEAPNRITPESARQYLEQYVAFLPVPVYLNERLISKGNFETRFNSSSRQFSEIGIKKIKENIFGGTFSVSTDLNGQVLVIVKEITMSGIEIDGSIALLQSGGQLMGLRSFFGLAPVPAIGNYLFGGYANLSFLKPTAGREALSRESIEYVTQIISLAEKATSELLATTAWADKNNAFLDWIYSHGRYDLGGNVTVNVLPEDKYVALSDVKSFVGKKTAHFYTGANKDTISIFANESSYLFIVAQGKTRRKVQLHYLQNLCGVLQAPDTAQITRVYSGSELSPPEASVLLRITSILRDDYLISDMELHLAEISHGVTVFPRKEGSQLRIYIAKSSTLLPPLLEFYYKAYDLFVQFMKDFVRVHIYPRIQDFVPSSTRDGVDALQKLLQRNRELYRYEDTEFGDPEGILGDYLSGVESLGDAFKKVRANIKAQSQSVTRDQVGSIEDAVPDVVKSPVVQQPEAGSEFEACPPIVRDDIVSDKKILTTGKKYPQLNNFTMLLGLSDRLMKTEADFFRSPHTTRILWGGHRVIYIFTESTGRLSLYYDIELRNQIEQTKAGGGMFPTTTLITKKRIFVPVPEALNEEFRVASGSKEFFVRFDILSSGSA